MWQKIKEHLGFISIICFYLVLFVPFLGQVHLFDWDEINFAEAAREMIVTGDWLNVQINYEPFWEKPPLFIWLQACSKKILSELESKIGHRSVKSEIHTTVPNDKPTPKPAHAIG